MGSVRPGLGRRVAAGEAAGQITTALLGEMGHQDVDRVKAATAQPPRIGRDRNQDRWRRDHQARQDQLGQLDAKRRSRRELVGVDQPAGDSGVGIGGVDQKAVAAPARRRSGLPIEPAGAGLAQKPRVADRLTTSVTVRRDQKLFQGRDEDATILNPSGAP